jgi:hypothetical protein
VKPPKTRNRQPHCTLYEALRPVLTMDARRLIVLVALILVVLERRTCVLNVLKTFISLPGSSRTRAQRIKRFMRYELPPELIARFVLSLLPAGKIWLILDRTHWKLGKVDINVLLLSVSWKASSLPLMWTVLNRSGNSHTSDRKALLQRFLIVHEEFKTTHKLGGLCADREFIGKDWFGYLRHKKIPICIRLKANTSIRGQELWRRFAHIKPGTAWSWRLRLPIHGVKLYVAATTTPTGERLFLATEHSSAKRALEEYARRWGAECLHQGLKGRGFRLEDSHLTHPQRVSTLLAVLSLAFIWCCLTGELRNHEAPIQLLNHGRLAMSFFRYGLDCLGEALRPGELKLFSRLVNLLACSRFFTTPSPFS